MGKVVTARRLDSESALVDGTGVLRGQYRCWTYLTDDLPGHDHDFERLEDPSFLGLKE